MGQQSNHWVIALVVYTFLKLADADLCTVSTTDVVNADDEFSFGTIFKLKVEGISANSIFHADTYFSGLSRKMRVNLMADALNIHVYHDYKNHETSTYNFPEDKPRTCKVDPNMRGGNGYYIVPHDIKEGDQPKVTDILRLSGSSGFGDDIKLHKSKDPVVFRTLSCTKYTSCQKIFDENGDEMVVEVSHLVSNTQFTKAEDGTVPIQITLNGEYVSGSKKSQAVSYTYNLYHYKKYFDHENIEYPLGVVCEDKKRLSDFPSLPTYMSFGQEIHYPDQTTKIETIETVFDKDLNFVEEKYFDEKGKIRMRRLDDFNTGLSYRLPDNDYSSCEVSKITDAPQLNDFVRGDDDTIEMVTPEQFFHSGGIQFYFNGIRHFDYIETEEWSGKDKKTGKIYSWFFTSNVEFSLNTYAKGAKDPSGENYRIPYKRMIWDDEKSNPTSTYFYKVDFTKPELTSNYYSCFKGNPKPVFIEVTGLIENQLVKDQKIVERRFTKTLVDALQISRLRIAHLQIDFIDDLGFVSFNLCGLPKVEGNRIKGRKKRKEPTQQAVMAMLKNKLKNESIMFNVGNKDILIESGGKIIENPYMTSFKLVVGEGSQGYSTGALAGLGVGMTLLGLLVGGAIGFWLFFKRG
ncbi:hypothetical protein RRG08_043476 [Elysia crispata]|uniref:Uncharacterized protein n=1 Tax=Elysia crispata TaxID=231223 RepID=A0AAE1CXU7_9GAST|nr:hypothetical protein RRG08_043476 [Elysia crispata]